MDPVLLYSLILVVSLFVLIKSSEYFTDSAEKIGLHFGIPAFIIGVTIVSFGTSLPELVSSVIAVISGNSEIVVGNVLGSNIANILIIMGIATIIAKKIKIVYEISHVDLPILLGSAFFLALTIWDGVFSIAEGFLALGGLVIYLNYAITSEKEQNQKQIKREMQKKLKKKHPLKFSVHIILILSGFFIYLGAKYTIQSVVELSALLNIGQEIIAAGIVALGTSLPELVVTITAAKRGNLEIAVGNILGSNIFNSFAVMGIPAMFGALLIPETIIFFSLPVMIIATLLFFFMTQEKVITKWEGWMLILFYVFFIGKLFNFI